ncbi:MAG: dicarboxylate/amino acid:cation symporter [Gammaproteobacteria bacterium]|nr:dicarboxylate/amino acid:cation symporter [Gammaproteobacteria bacterium]MDH5728940.1 dicarboxylate/amino acid:cation symporter [Gammaproteobacteria bacterium]
MLKLKLHWQILIALGLAVMMGSLTGVDAAIFGLKFYDVYNFLGTLFLNALKMLIVPLIVSAIITGMMGIGASGSLGRLGGKTLVYYMTTSLFAILIGLAVVNMVQPGIVDGEPAKEIIGLSADTSSFEQKVEGKGAGDVAEIFIRMVPPNIVNAAANGQMLGLIFFSLLFGYFLANLQGKKGDTQRDFWQGVFDIMMKITELVMKFAPIGVFGLVAKVIASTGLEAFEPLAMFFFSVLAALLVHFLVTMPLLLAFVGKVNPIAMYRAMAPALLTAFSTSSSSATLPLTMDCVEKNAGVSNKTSSFVLPLGATVNMDGTALYECVAAIFIAQAYGLDLSFAMQFTIVLTALLTSIGVAGIPSASLVAISIILAAIGLPAEGIGLILAVDRVLDMCRTSVNVFSDACGAVILARLEGEKPLQQKA